MSTLSILDAARQAPRDLALSDGARAISFAELGERVRERMRSLESLRGELARRPGLVAVVTGEQRPTIELLLALLELGAPFLPLHERWTPAEREAVLASSPVSALLEPAKTGGVSSSARTSQPDAIALQLLTQTAPLAALATSGSTGSPRLTLLGRAAFIAAAEASAARLGWQPQDRWLLCLPLAHVGGLSVVTRCLLARRAVVLLPVAGERSSNARLALALEQGRPTLASMVPAQLQGLLELGAEFELPRSVRAILTGGAAASAHLLERCAERGWPVLTSYGLTEACSQVATQRPGSVNRGHLGVGVPLPGVGVRIDGGVIHITGPTLASGYLGGAGSERIDPEVGFRTRDLGRFDADGQLHVLGRVDDLIISGGENVSPFEVEAALERCAGVLGVCAFGVPDARFGEVVALGVRTAATDERALIAAVDREARHGLARFKRPRFYVCAREFAYTPSGKLDRIGTSRRLRACVEAAPASFRAPPDTPDVEASSAAPDASRVGSRELGGRRRSE